MKNITEYNKIIFNKNINSSFYFYCLKKDIKLIRFLAYNFLNFIISFLFNSKKSIYEIKKFRYLKHVSNLEKKVENFYKRKKLNKYYNLDDNLIIAKTPIILIDKQYRKNTICYELNDNYEVKLGEFNSKINKIKQVDELYATSFDLLKKVNANKKFYVNNRLMYNIRNKHIPKWINTILLLMVLSTIITSISFTFAITVLDFSFIKSYFEIKLFIMNFIPIFILLSLIFIISKRIHIAYLISSFLVFALGIANQTKLLYRDDIVKFEDLFLLKEAKIMAERYTILIKPATILFVIISIVIFFIIKKYIKKINLKWWKRLIISLLIIVFTIIGYNKIYTVEKIYDSLGDTSKINIWIGTRQYQIRGLIYPFIYTMKDGIDVEPENYNEENIKNKLNKYTYQNIPEDKKVNVIAIMLEAYNDFSKFKEIKFKEDIYSKFHKIQDKSISGTLITTVFGGGTIVTERNFLTGYYSFPSYRKNTNSYVWYFKEQGYRTEANHPIYGAFYNRQSVNSNLGFDDYYNYENRYSKIQENFVNDHIFFEDIIKGFEASKANNTPYFNFSVTYQNHGPYNTRSYEGKPYYFNQGKMSEEGYNTINEYFKGIKDTNDALYELINYFEKEEQPTIIILFGDHNPFLGDNALAYNELGINMDISTLDGFLNYYETPYIIYGNKGAKKMFNKTFEGKGNSISPMFLMNELFDYIELEGNEYLQYMSELKSNIDVINSNYLKIDNKYIPNNNDNNLLEEYKLINYYVSRNFETKIKATK